VPPSCVLNVGISVYVSPLFVQFHCRESLLTVILKIIIKPQMSYECGVWCVVCDRILKIGSVM